MQHFFINGALVLAYLFLPPNQTMRLTGSLKGQSDAATNVFVNNNNSLGGAKGDAATALLPQNQTMPQTRSLQGQSNWEEPESSTKRRKKRLHAFKKRLHAFKYRHTPPISNDTCRTILSIGENSLHVVSNCDVSRTIYDNHTSIYSTTADGQCKNTLEVSHSNGAIHSSNNHTNNCTTKKTNAPWGVSVVMNTNNEKKSLRGPAL